MKYLQIIDIATCDVVEEIDITDKAESFITKLELGLMAKMNTEKYFTDIIER